MKKLRVSSHVTVRDTDPLVREHRVHDIHILPGVSMLDAVYKTLVAAKIPADSVVLREILFHEPVVTHATMDRKLTVSVSVQGDRGEVSVSSVPSRNGEVVSKDSTLHMNCVLWRTDALATEPALLPLAADTPLGAPVDLAQCYAVTDKIGIHHESFMKCLGTVVPLDNGRCKATMALGERAAARVGDFLLHPVFLDGSTIVPLFSLRDRHDEATLFIPFAIEEFRTVGMSGHLQVQVLVDGSDIGSADPEQELLRYSSTLYDMNGQPLARIRNFGVKRVRSLEGINRLLASGNSSRLHAVASVPAQPVQVAKAAAVSSTVQAGSPVQAGVDVGDALLALVGSMVAKGSGGAWKNEDADKPFFDLGLDSLALLDMAEELEVRLGVRLYPTLLFECPTAAQLAAYLHTTFPAEVTASLGAAATAGASKPAGATAANSQATSQAAAQAKQKPPTHTPSRVPAPVATRNPQEPLILVPRWMPLPPATAGASTHGRTIALLGGGAGLAPVRARLSQLGGDSLCFQSKATSGANIAAELREALESGLRFDTLWLLDLDHDAVFSIAKVLLEAGQFTSAGLALKAITFNAFEVHASAPHEDAAHGVWGLLQSLSREHSQIRVSQLDLDRVELDNALGHDLSLSDRRVNDYLLPLLLRESGNRELRALRGGRLYERRLFAVQDTPAPASRFRQGGAYLIVGGAGGVGMELMRHLRRHHGAQVAIVGRRPLNDELLNALQAEGEYGRDIVYAQADVEDAAALRHVIDSVQATFGGLHGVVHSAMVLDDKRLVEMDHASFTKVLAPKAQGMRALAQATQGLDLDFLLVFSSMQSYVGNASQGNYAAASTYVDGFAASLRATRAHPVVVVNWGFWSEVGAVATPVYRQLLARQGVFGLGTEQALGYLEKALACGWQTALIVAAEDVVLEEMGWSRELVLAPSNPAQRLDLPAAPQASDAAVQAQSGLFSTTGEAITQLIALAGRRVAQVLHDLGLGDGGAAAVDQAIAAGRVAREHAALAKTLQLRFGAEAGLDEAGFLQAVDQLTPAQPALRHFVPLLRAGVAAYPAILSGQVAAAEVLFPNGSPELVRAVYGESEVSRFYNQVVADAVQALASRGIDIHIDRDSASPIRILEIGAGTGSTTVEVLRVLNAAGIPCEYVYTDLWDKLIADARKRLGPVHPELRFSFLDVSTDPALQGMTETFDIVVATNVLHATRDLHLSLRHAKRLLKPGGALVMNESVEVQDFSTLTFGLLPGWWSAADAHERLPLSPLADTAGWTRLLQDEGYVRPQALLPAVAEAPSMNAQQILVAYSDGETRHPGALRAKASPQPVAAQQPHQLPATLQGRLRPYNLESLTHGTATRQPRKLKLFLDDGGHLWIFLDHPGANTFTEELLGELITTLHHVSRHAPDLVQGRLVYLSHFGEYFSLGGDRTEIVQRLVNGQHEDLSNFAQKAAELLRALTTMNSIVVAVVDGTAQGGGMETLFATDLQLVGEHVQLGLPEIKSGLIPGMGGLSFLKTQIGMARTKRMVMLGELMSAQEAHALGLISHVVADPFAAALDLPRRLSHVGTALEMKKILARDTKHQHTVDIDDWLQHVLQNDTQIDTRRIENAGLLIKAKMANSSQSGPSHPPSPSSNLKVAA